MDIRAFAARFNSKLVRLKVDEPIESAIKELRFNSKLVRLKGGKQCRIRDPFLRFNSKLVRLKDLEIWVQCWR